MLPLQSPHPVIPLLPEAFLSAAHIAEEVKEQAIAAREQIIDEWNTQEHHPMIPVLTPEFARTLTLQKLAECLVARRQRIEQIQSDNYNHGIRFPAWDANFWEILKLRLRNPGLPIKFMVGGANGSAKTFFASNLVIQAMMQHKSKGGIIPMFWCLTVDEPNSETVQQAALYYWLPNEYKTEGGGIKASARGKLKYNDSGGFTDNRFSLYHGAKMECRFWSKEITTLEGPRPVAVWSDEGVPIDWIEGVDKRLLTWAEKSLRHMEQWKMLLAMKQKNPALEFPTDKLGELIIGLHLITYTAKNGYTETVRKFVENGTVMEEIEADPELLPVRDAAGNITAGENIPRLIYSKDRSAAQRMMFAWENPIGGNWAGMREKAKTKKRAEILWWCYGVAEKNADTPFPNFNVQAHVRPKTILPPSGTWYLIADPVASGGRSWSMVWAYVSGVQHGNVWPGDIIIAHEYPQTNDNIPGLGSMGPWAEPGGKNGRGVKGPAQDAWPVGYEFRASEIRRIEAKIAGWMRDMHKHTAPTISVPDGNRIMDSRAANTETANNSDSKTIIEYMEDNAIFFIPAGRDSGAASGETNVQPGEQMLNDAFYFDRELAVINPKTGWLEIDPQKGRGPKLWILEHCTNTIDAIQNYPGILNDGRHSAFKDFIDCLRYLIIARPEYIDPDRQAVSYGGYYGPSTDEDTV